MKAKRLSAIFLTASLVLMTFLNVATVTAQFGDGSLRGTVTDEQGLALPGVTVSASSEDLITPRTAVTDEKGEFRIANLPPGMYTLTGELEGFSVYRQDGIYLRAGANFLVDMTLTIGGMSETLTVTAESPMLEVTNPGNVLNLDGEFQRELPISEGKYWSDFLQMTPGVLSRPHNDGSGRQNYFGNAVDHRDAVLLMEGFVASNYNDSNINRTALSTAAIEDTQLKLGGVDAAAPMGYGLVVNVVSKSGGDSFSGSADWTYQPFSWNGDNTGGEGIPATRSVNQADFSFGGPIVREKAWFFAAARWQANGSSSSRTPEQAATLRAVFNTQELDDNTFDGFQPWVKVTSQLSSRNTLSAVYQNDRLHLNTAEQIAARRLEVLSTGGSMYGVRLNSLLTDNLTSNFAFSYNNKGGNSEDSYSEIFPGPSIQVNQNAFVNGGIVEGTGLLARGGANRSVECDVACKELDTASVLMLRGDLTWYKDEMAGSHAFDFGFLVQPRNTYRTETVYLNDGFVLSEEKFANPDDPSQGTIPFHRQYVTSDLSLITANGRDSDNGFYVQDTWRPNDRITATLGVRMDLVRRRDERRNFQYQTSTEVGPRLGVSYLLTEDAKNVLRASYARVHEQLQGGRHPVSSFGGSDAAAFRDEYDVLGNGSFTSIIETPARAATTSELLYDDNLSQPIIDEYIVGFRRQFSGETSVDVAGVFRTIHNMFGQFDINGFYPSGPSQPFGGFGRIDPDQGIVYQLNNNDWSEIQYQALQVTVTKNMTRAFQVVAAVHKQWQHLTGTWNPTDPAGFIQPDAFPDNKLLFRTRGPADDNSYPGSTNANMWFPYSVRLGVTWHAPLGVQVSGSYSIIKPSWSGWIVDRLSANDPDVTQYGPSTVTSSTGSRQSNPLANRIRFVYPTRGEGQELLPAVNQIGIKLAKRFSLGGDQFVTLSGNILNPINAGNGFEWARGGANRVYSGAYLQPGNIQPSRAFQLDVAYQF